MGKLWSLLKVYRLFQWAGKTLKVYELTEDDRTVLEVLEQGEMSGLSIQKLTGIRFIYVTLRKLEKMGLVYRRCIEPSPSEGIRERRWVYGLIKGEQQNS